jgi:hypothetical protein
MKPTSLQSQLVKLGATVRLQSLNRERDILLRILDQKDDEVKQKDIIKSLKKRKYTKRKKQHWTQTSAGKRLMAKHMKQRWADGDMPIRKKK